MQTTVKDAQKQSNLEQYHINKVKWNKTDMVEGETYLCLFYIILYFIFRYLSNKGKGRLQVMVDESSHDSAVLMTMESREPVQQLYSLGFNES